MSFIFHVILTYLYILVKHQINPSYSFLSRTVLPSSGENGNYIKTRLGWDKNAKRRWATGLFYYSKHFYVHFHVLTISYTSNSEGRNCVACYLWPLKPSLTQECWHCVEQAASLTSGRSANTTRHNNTRRFVAHVGHRKPLGWLKEILTILFCSPRPPLRLQLCNLMLSRPRHRV